MIVTFPPFLPALALLLALILGPLPAGAAPPIVVGQSIDLSGPDGNIGRDYVAGIRTCFDALNAAGGIHGRPIEYLTIDDRGDPNAAARAAATLLNDRHADVLFGGIGEAPTAAILASPAFTAAQALLYAPLTAPPAQARASRVVFWRPDRDAEFDYLLSHFSRLGVRRLGIAYQPSAAAAFDRLRRRLPRYDMKLTGAAVTGGASESPATAARALAAGRPGFVLVLADTVDTALFLRSFRRLDARTYVAGTSLTDLTTLREIAGPAAVEWTVFSQVVPNPAARRSMLQIAHLETMAKFRDEAVSSMTLEGYAAAATLAQALAARGGLPGFLERQGAVDVGGLAVYPSAPDRHLSRFLDIALFSKGRLVF